MGKGEEEEEEAVTRSEILPIPPSDNTHDPEAVSMWLPYSLRPRLRKRNKAKIQLQKSARIPQRATSAPQPTHCPGSFGAKNWVPTGTRQLVKLQQAAARPSETSHCSLAQRHAVQQVHCACG
jgi:hypothetical protein